MQNLNNHSAWASLSAFAPHQLKSIARTKLTLISYSRFSAHLSHIFKPPSDPNLIVYYAQKPLVLEHSHHIKWCNTPRDWASRKVYSKGDPKPRGLEDELFGTAAWRSKRWELTNAPRVSWGTKRGRKGWKNKCFFRSPPTWMTSMKISDSEKSKSYWSHWLIQAEWQEQAWTSDRALRIAINARSSQTALSSWRMTSCEHQNLWSCGWLSGNYTSLEAQYSGTSDVQ